MAGVSFGAAGGAGAEEAKAKEKGVGVVVDVPNLERLLKLQVLVGELRQRNPERTLALAALEGRTLAAFDTRPVRLGNSLILSLDVRTSCQSLQEIRTVSQRGWTCLPS